MQRVVRTSRQLGAIIRQARKDAGLTQAALGEKAGIWQETVSKIENGQSVTSLETVLDILAALGLEITIAERGEGVPPIEDIF